MSEDQTADILEKIKLILVICATRLFIELLELFQVKVL